MIDTAPHQHGVLLAEEQTVVRDLVVHVLGRLNYRIDTVATGRDVLVRARSADYGLILLSATLPDAPGPALVAELRSGEGVAPIVVICPEGQQELLQACHAAGAAECLTRPLEIERLLRVAERLVRRGTEFGGRHDAPVLDLGHLRSITDGDSQLEGELATLYLSTAEVYLQGMGDALESGQSWSRAAHALKGASANLGARRVAALAQAAERSPPTRGELDAIQRAVAEVRTLFDRQRDLGELVSGAAPAAEIP